MLMVIGACTIHWAMVEALLDTMVAVCFHRFGGNALEKDIPKMLNRKIDLLRRVFNRRPELADAKDAARVLFDKTKALADQRHLLTHGTPSVFWSDKIEYTWIKVTPKMHMVEKHEVTFSDAYSLARESLNLAHELAPIAQAMGAFVVNEHQGKPGGEIRAKLS
jgi:hypothetical protein